MFHNLLFYCKGSGGVEEVQTTLKFSEPTVTTTTVQALTEGKIINGLKRGSINDVRTGLDCCGLCMEQKPTMAINFDSEKGKCNCLVDTNDGSGKFKIIGGQARWFHEYCPENGAGAGGPDG